MLRGISNIKKHLYNCNCFDTNDANFIKKVNMYKNTYKYRLNGSIRLRRHDNVFCLLFVNFFFLNYVVL